jgi:hypothetical protein
MDCLPAYPQGILPSGVTWIAISNINRAENPIVIRSYAWSAAVHEGYWHSRLITCCSIPRPESFVAIAGRPSALLIMYKLSRQPTEFTRESNVCCLLNIALSFSDTESARKT